MTEGVDNTDCLGDVPVPTLLVRVRSGARIVYANAWATLLLGPTEAAGRALSAAWGTLGADDLERDLRRCHRLGDRLELDAVRGPDDDHASFRIHAAPWGPSEEGLVVVTLVDITAERTAARTAREERSRLRRANQRDALTGALTRRHFFRAAERVLQDTTEAGEASAVAMLDLDHFKTLNDTFGHDVGDRALVEVSGTCLAVLRDSDLCGRLGGEEFAFLLPGLELSDARRVGERVRLAIEALRVPTRQGPTSVTASVGLTLLAPGEQLAAGLQRADQALYHAKRAGRNVMAVYEEISWSEEDGG